MFKTFPICIPRAAHQLILFFSNTFALVPSLALVFFFHHQKLIVSHGTTIKPVDYCLTYVLNWCVCVVSRWLRGGAVVPFVRCQDTSVQPRAESDAASTVSLLMMGDRNDRSPQQSELQICFKKKKYLFYSKCHSQKMKSISGKVEARRCSWWVNSFKPWWVAI